MRAVLALTFMLFVSDRAQADFDRWSVETTDDPFNGGQAVVANYATSLRSGVFIECNSNSGTVALKAIAGWAYTDEIAYVTPTVQYAIDGKVIEITASATSVGAYGDNIAGVRVDFTPEEGRKLVEAFASAKKQIAIKDGISDRPHLLSARGSTASGKKLLACISKIAPAETTTPETVPLPKSTTAAAPVDDKTTSPSLIDIKTPEGVGFAMTAWAACLTTHDFASRQVGATVNATVQKHIRESFPRYQVGQEQFNSLAATDIDNACQVAMDSGILAKR